METADRIGDRASHVWPDPRQLLLLKAVLEAGPEGAAAFKEWQAQADLDAVDYGSYRLLPRLYESLRARGVSHLFMGRLGGLYRHTWFRNQTLLTEAAKTLDLLRSHGTEAMLLKGAALAHGYHESVGLRPMDDVDFLVREAAGPAVAELLLKAGYSTEREYRDVPDLIARYHSANFTAPAGGQIDLHWRLHQNELGPGPDDHWWARSAAGDLRGVPVRYPHPAHLLAHVVIHGLSRVQVPTIHWVADAVTILGRTGGRFDWNPLVEEGARVQVSPFLADALAWLHAEFGVPVPRHALARLRGAALPLRVRILHRAKTRPESFWPALYEAIPWDGLAEVRRAGPTRYLMERWELEKPSRIPAGALRYAGRKLRGLREAARRSGPGRPQ